VQWTDRSITQDEWAELIALGNLYYNLPMLTNATALVGYCSSIEPKYNVEFLTALPSKKTMPDAEDDKTRWIKKYFPTYKVNFGPFSTDKWKWCKPGDILIDDRSSNIIDWYEKGKGIGIYYKENITHTLSIIDKVIGKTEPMRFLDETTN
jgi:5'(3')-deoxyribonucleotidase